MQGVLAVVKLPLLESESVLKSSIFTKKWSFLFIFVLTCSRYFSFIVLVLQN